MRPTRNEYFLRMAKLVSTRGTCLRRQVGCILVNVRGHVLATGYNGVAANLPHCNHEERKNHKRVYMAHLDQFKDSWDISHPHACAGAESPSGKNLDACEAIHAEQNALLQCYNVWDIEACFVTVSPCITCVKLLLNTGCKYIIFSEAYAHDDVSRRLWTTQKDRHWVHEPGLPNAN